MKNIFSSPIHFPCGKSMKNRFMLAPLTNRQSHEDGTLSEDEYHWLVKRAAGGFGLTMTCASHVQEIGQGFPGQLGIFSDKHIAGHQKLSAGIKACDSLAVIQLHHAGMRSPEAVIGQQPVCPSDYPKFNARGLSLEEVIQLREDFITAALRAQKSGYDGVEIHGAHGYILTQFLSSATNKRTDLYGGSLENRARLLFEIVNAVREKCGQEFLLGVRLSPENVDMPLDEVKTITKQLIEEGNIDFLDISLWDSFKMPEEEGQKHESLLKHFTEIDRGNIKLTVAGKIKTGQDVKTILEAGVDFVSIGRSGILHHDFPRKVIENEHFIPIATPVSKEHLKKEGLGADFITYMQRWEGFVAE